MHFKRYLFVCQGRDGKLVESASNLIAWQRDLFCGTRVRRKLYMVLCHNCHIYGTWRRKELGGGEVLKLKFWGQVTKGKVVFMMGN